MPASGIKTVHRAVGMAGPESFRHALTCLATRNGFVGRNRHLFTQMGEAEDLDRAV